jgi:MFS family permease
VNELERLGRPGAYRLGDLRAQGAGPVPPAPYRPSFTRPARRGPLSAWVMAFAAGVVATAVGAVAGLFFAAFLVGLLAGLVTRWSGWRPRPVLAAAAAMAVTGWAVALAWQAAHAAGARAAPRAVTGALDVAGLPAHGTRGIAVALLAGALQALAGAWLGRVADRVLAARRAGHVRVPPSDTGGPDRAAASGDGVRLLGERAGSLSGPRGRRG